MALVLRLCGKLLLSVSPMQHDDANATVMLALIKAREADLAYPLRETVQYEEAEAPMMRCHELETALKYAEANADVAYEGWRNRGWSWEAIRLANDRIECLEQELDALIVEFNF